MFKTRNSLNSLVSYGICAFDQEQINGKLLLNGQSAFLPNSLKERLPEGLDFSLQGLGSYSLDLNKPKQSSIQAELDCLWKYKHDELKIESESEVRLQLQEGRAAARSPPYKEATPATTSRWKTSSLSSLYRPGSS